VSENERAGRPGFGATMAEVAALAGVTKMTVSRVLRHPEKVTPATRARVSEAIASLGYVPNRLAGSLTAGVSGLVAAIVPTLRHSLFADTLEGLGDVLSEAGLDLIVSSSSYRTDIEENQIRSILERRPDALVLTGLTHTSGTRDLLRTFGVPVVETWETGDEPVDMVVGYSNRKAAHAMTAHLLKSAYRRIVFVNGPSDNNERARHRAEGYLAAMQEAGIAPLPIHVVHDEGAISPETGAQALRAVLSEIPDTDALFFTSDVFAVGAILACREQGIAVPGDLGIAGFHDLEIGRVVSPALTTVHVPALEMGRRAGEMVLARLSGNAFATRDELGFTIIQRDSTRLTA
jgi:LacI family gluconate utilization system Gnt-I transcriptional repressor